MTDYERARVRLIAFGLLDGWGGLNEKGIHVPCTLETRKEHAIALADWAATETESAKS